MIVTIGGGSGMPIINQALIKAGFSNINSIVTTFDSGGDTGRIRTDERGSVLAFSDYWRSLISLWDDDEQKQYWQEMLNYRDGRGRNFGNLFFQFMAERSGSLSKVDALFCNLTGAKLCGRVIPVSLESSNIVFKTISKKEYLGQHMMNELRMSDDLVTEFSLLPMVNANPEAIKSIENADLIIICPGSLYGSIVVNLLPVGIKESIISSKARTMLMTNIMSIANENPKFDQNKYIKVFKNYIGNNFDFDTIVMPKIDVLDKIVLKKILGFYKMENSFPIKYNKIADGRNVVLEDIVAVDEVNLRLRHSVDKLAKYFAKMDYVSEKN